MKKTFIQSKDEIAQLCKYFECNHHEFLASGIKEAHVRQSLIDPFFIALGWDVRNDNKVAPQYREVIPEASLDVEGQQKAPDYSFRVGTLPKFYAEAKKCGVNINADPGPAYQLRRYGWSAKVALSILTDFEELGVYDCTMRPRPGDKASRARIQYFNFEEYPDRWREVWDVFSREAVWSGAFDKYTASKRKRGTSEVDVEFLKEIESWRDTLARNIALRNKDLSSDDLNAAVQRTIDRVIFLRMAEDRGIEPCEQLLKLCERSDIYSRFMRDVCYRADQKYNSGLFHFQKEKGISEVPDQITPRLTVDDKAIKPILQNLYFAHGSPYHFGVLPVEILGTVYERFLGKVIRLTAGHHAKIEEKPEVRKSGGVYYTPAYIVNYITKHTVGIKIEGKSPSQLAGGKKKDPLRILDMACGSGSFLLGAYQYLLDYCLKWYMEHTPSRYKKAVFKDERTGEWRLTIEEKKRILTTHIFGVDIDSQAVEVSKLSLLLKVLESETDQTIGRQMKLFRERALPNLSDNIKCGNSLIGQDYFIGKLIPDSEDIKRINPFDYEQEFPEAMKAGGFDCVIGNPPYIRMLIITKNELNYFSRNYDSATGHYDTYVLFVEKGSKLLNSSGILGMIVPHKFFQGKYGRGLRGFLATRGLNHIVDFADQQVFSKASTYTCLLFTTSTQMESFAYHNLAHTTTLQTELAELSPSVTDSQSTSILINQASLSREPWNFYVGGASTLMPRLESEYPVLLDYCQRIYQGLATTADPIYIVEHVANLSKTLTRVRSKILGAEVDLEASILKPLLKGADIRRYHLLPCRHYCIFPYTLENEKATIIAPKIMREEFHHTYDYLHSLKAKLDQREHGKMTKRLDWYGYSQEHNLQYFDAPKILTQVLARQSTFMLDGDGQFYFVGGGNAGGYGIVLKSTVDISFQYVLGLLNSKLLDFFLKQVSTRFRGGYYSYAKRFIQQLPIRPIKMKDRSDKVHNAEMTKLVDSMITLHKQLVNAESSAKKDVIQRRIDATGADIDHLVYDLYRLTEEEIAIVEGNNP